MSPALPQAEVGNTSLPVSASLCECEGLPLCPKHDIQDTASQSNFLGLPGEVRNKIIRYAITTDHWIRLSDRKPGLLFVNRQTSSETVPIYLTENKFEIDQAIMLSKCATAVLVERFQIFNAINVFTVPRWSFGLPIWSQRYSRSKDYREDANQSSKNCQELINFLTSTGPSKTIEFHFVAAAGIHDRQVQPGSLSHDPKLSVIIGCVEANRSPVRISTHPVNWQRWIEALDSMSSHNIQADLMRKQAPGDHADWEIEMDLVGQSKSSYRKRVKFRKTICKALKSYNCPKLTKNGYRVIGIWNKGKDGSQPSFTIKPVMMQSLKWHMAPKNDDSKAGGQSKFL